MSEISTQYGLDRLGPVLDLEHGGDTGVRAKYYSYADRIQGDKFIKEQYGPDAMPIKIPGKYDNWLVPIDPNAETKTWTLLDPSRFEIGDFADLGGEIAEGVGDFVGMGKVAKGVKSLASQLPGEIGEKIAGSKFGQNVSAASFGQLTRGLYNMAIDTFGPETNVPRSDFNTEYLMPGLLAFGVGYGMDLIPFAGLRTRKLYKDFTGAENRREMIELSELLSNPDSAAQAQGVFPLFVDLPTFGAASQSRGALNAIESGVLSKFPGSDEELMKAMIIARDQGKTALNTISAQLSVFNTMLNKQKLAENARGLNVTEEQIQQYAKQNMDEIKSYVQDVPDEQAIADIFDNVEFLANEIGVPIPADFREVYGGPSINWNAINNASAEDIGRIVREGAEFRLHNRLELSRDMKYDDIINNRVGYDTVNTENPLENTLGVFNEFTEMVSSNPNILGREYAIAIDEIGRVFEDSVPLYAKTDMSGDAFASIRDAVEKGASPETIREMQELAGGRTTKMARQIEDGRRALLEMRGVKVDDARKLADWEMEALQKYGYNRTHSREMSDMELAILDHYNPKNAKTDSDNIIGFQKPLSIGMMMKAHKNLDEIISNMKDGSAKEHVMSFQSALWDDIVDTAKTVDSEAGDLLNQTRDWWKLVEVEEIEPFISKMINEGSDIDVFDWMMKESREGVNRLEGVFRNLPREHANAVKGLLFERMGRTNPANEFEDNFSISNFVKFYEERLSDGAKKLLFTGDAGYYDLQKQQMDNLVKILKPIADKEGYLKRGKIGEVWAASSIFGPLISGGAIGAAVTGANPSGILTGAGVAYGLSKTLPWAGKLFRSDAMIKWGSDFTAAVPSDAGNFKKWLADPEFGEKFRFWLNRGAVLASDENLLPEWTEWMSSIGENLGLEVQAQEADRENPDQFPAFAAELLNDPEVRAEIELKEGMGIEDEQEFNWELGERLLNME